MPNTRSHIHNPVSLGDRASDRIATLLGSWRGLGVMTGFIFVWITLNVLPVLRHWDPMPFILLNLVFSTQAFYAAPIILMSQNRQSSKDRLRDDHEAETVDDLAALAIAQHEVLCQKLDAILTLLHAPD